MRAWRHAGAAFLAAAAGAGADTITITADRDNTLYQSATGALSNGLGEGFFVGRTATGLIRRGLVHFDVAGAIPAGSTITSVELALNLSMTISFDHEVRLHRALKDWGEGTSVAGLPGGIGGGGGAPVTTGDASWIHTFYDSQFWAAPGGTPSGPAPDYAETASAAATVGNTVQVYTWGSTPEMVADVQAWLDNPSQNFGWFVIGDETAPTTAKRFDTKDHPDPTVRPQLIITFTPPGPVCYPNCDQSTGVPFLNVNDFICFQAAFAAGSSYANCDGSTTEPLLNVNDFICFQSAFAAGCSAP